MPVTYTNLVITVGGSGFYSWSNSISVADTNQSGGSSFTASFNTDGTVTFTTSVGDTLTENIDHWHNGGTVAGIGNSRWAKKTNIDGVPGTGTLGTSPTALTEARTLTITAAVQAVDSIILIEIYSNAEGTTKVGEITLTMAAGWDNGGTVGTVGTVESVIP